MQVSRKLPGVAEVRLTQWRLCATRTLGTMGQSIGMPVAIQYSCIESPNSACGAMWWFYQITAHITATLQAGLGIPQPLATTGWQAR